MLPLVGILDLGGGNLCSVRNAFDYLGASTEVVQSSGQLGRCSHVVLPGVGAFASAMASLRARGLEDALQAHVESSRPLLGICLGMQLLADRGEEFGGATGLGLIPGVARPLEPADASLAVPHVGWNQVRMTGDSILTEGIPDETSFYFVHSYVIEGAGGAVRGEFDYGGGFAAVVERKRLFGVQFHPEKSQAAGIQLLQNFLGLR